MLGIACTVLLAGCDSAPAERVSDGLDSGAALLSTRDILGHPDTVWLETDSADPLGLVADLDLWQGQVAIADGLQSNIKVFSSDGALVRTIGRVGDGPGEFRHPVSIEAVGEDLWVLDARMRLSRFGPEGELRGTVLLPGYNPSHIRSNPSSPGLIVSARFPTEALPENRGENRAETPDAYALLVIDSVGTPLERGYPLRGFDELYRSNFSEILFAATDNFFVTLDWTDNLIEVRSRLSGSPVRQIEIEPDWYRPPEWPSERFSDLDGITRWANQQFWASGLEHAGEDRVLVTFSGPRASATSRATWTVLVDISSGLGFASSTPRDRGLHAVVGAHALSAGTTLKDEAFLERTRISVPPTRSAGQ
jgi:hypothetical protein